jgi:hypothetical protein
LRSTAKRDITLSERLAVALVSFVAAGLTVAFFGSVAFFAGAMLTMEYVKTVSLWGVIASLGVGVAGFFLGGERAAYCFGILWGTQEATEKQLALTLGFIILVCGIIAFVALT